MLHMSLWHRCCCDLIISVYCVVRKCTVPIDWEGLHFCIKHGRAKGSYCGPTGPAFHCRDLHSSDILTKWHTWMHNVICSHHCKHCVHAKTEKQSHICTHDEQICYGWSKHKCINPTDNPTQFHYKEGVFAIPKAVQHYVIWRLFCIGTFYQSAIDKSFV